jgi:RNA polymerase sigma-70 factor (ECF subfamily)
MMRAARRILGCDHLAADAMQDTLLALWRERVAAPQEPAAWLVRAVVHRALHLRRTLLRRRRYEASTDAVRPAGCENPLHALWLQELDGRFRQAVALLPPDQREVVHLRTGAGLDYRAIARAVGAPVGTVRSRLSRARASLAESLRGMEPDRR